MGFFDRIFGGKRVFAGKEQPAFVAELTICGKRYILDRFDMGFQQDVDNKNRPNGEAYGGTITASTSEVLAAVVNDWAISNTKTLDGKIKVYNNSDTLDEGAQMVITFQDAYCLGMKKETGKQDEVSTTFTISPALIKIDNEAIELRPTNKNLEDGSYKL